MKGHHKEYLAERIATHLRHELARGEYLHALPGERTLAESLGVSRTVLRQAIVILEKGGHLMKSTAGSARRTAPQYHSSATRGLRVGLLTGKERHTTSQPLLRELTRLCAKFGAECVHIEAARPPEMQVEAQVARLVGQYHCDLWIGAALPHVALPDALHAAGQRVLGFNFVNPKPYGTVGVDFHSAHLHAVNLLLRAGRTRVVIPSVMRDPVTTEAISKLFEARGLPFDHEVRQPSYDATRAGFAALCNRLFSAAEPPDGIVFMSITDVQLVTLQGELMKRRLKYPEDLSVLGINTVDYLTLMTPRPSVYMVKPARMHAALLKIVRDFITTGRLSTERKLLEMEYVPGESV